MKPKSNLPKSASSGILSVLKPYWGLVSLLILFALLSNGLNLWMPKIVGKGIDAYTAGNFSFRSIITEFLVISILVFIFNALQSVIQTYASERVARDLRTQLAEKISKQDFAFITRTDPSKLLTNLTADVDSIKLFVSQAMVSIISSVFIIIGASVLLLGINWRLGLTVMAIIPIIGGAFYLVLRKVRALFKKSREVLDRLNKVINESILGAALIRVINSQHQEYNKFIYASTRAKGISLSIVRLFAWLIPIIIFTANISGLTILLLGGHYVITNQMTLGSFAAFNSYLALLIFPILVIGFMSNVIAQASASFGRLKTVLDAAEPKDTGTIETPLTGTIEVKDVWLNYKEKEVLRQISFVVNPGSRLAIIGPTAAGKTQLLYLLSGLIKPDKGTIYFDNKLIEQYKKQSFYNQVALVFQDSIMFNMSIKENIAFSNTVSNDSLDKAIQTAELSDFINELPQGLDTLVSERGLSLSGGQKQRIMLARALAIEPKILLLDDFTARVDLQTEGKILANIKRNYPELTLISVTQKIAAVKDYDQIMLLMQAELLDIGTHEELMQKSPEYVQIFNSQLSTSSYEL
jgi:ATP-binding cassette subfamily B protein